MSYLKCARFVHREGLKPRIRQGKVEDPDNQFSLKVAEGERRSNWIEIKKGAGPSAFAKVQNRRLSRQRWMV
jgi:hypothetical protein